MRKILLILLCTFLLFSCPSGNDPISPGNTETGSTTMEIAEAVNDALAYNHQSGGLSTENNSRAIGDASFADMYRYIYENDQFYNDYKLQLTDSRFYRAPIVVDTEKYGLSYGVFTISLEGYNQDSRGNVAADRIYMCFEDGAGIVSLEESDLLVAISDNAYYASAEISMTDTRKYRDGALVSFEVVEMKRGEEYSIEINNLYYKEQRVINIGDVEEDLISLIGLSNETIEYDDPSAVAALNETPNAFNGLLDFMSTGYSSIESNRLDHYAYFAIHRGEMETNIDMPFEVTHSVINVNTPGGVNSDEYLITGKLDLYSGEAISGFVTFNEFYISKESENIKHSTNEGGSYQIQGNADIDEISNVLYGYLEDWSNGNESSVASFSNPRLYNNLYSSYYSSDYSIGGYKKIQLDCDYDEHSQTGSLYIRLEDKANGDNYTASFALLGGGEYEILSLDLNRRGAYLSRLDESTHKIIDDFMQSYLKTVGII